jgi:hypothetical protein
VFDGVFFKSHDGDNHVRRRLWVTIDVRKKVIFYIRVCIENARKVK